MLDTMFVKRNKKRIPEAAFLSGFVVIFGQTSAQRLASCLRIIPSRSALIISFSSSGKRETASNCGLRSFLFYCKILL